VEVVVEHASERCGNWNWFGAKQYAHLARAEHDRRGLSASIHFAVHAAMSAAVSAGDARAGQAYRALIGVVEPTRQYPVVSAVGADAMSAHGGVEATAQELIHLLQYAVVNLT